MAQKVGEREVFGQPVHCAQHLTRLGEHSFARRDPTPVEEQLPTPLRQRHHTSQSQPRGVGGLLTVNKLRAQVQGDGESRVGNVQDAASDALPSLEHPHHLSGPL